MAKKKLEAIEPAISTIPLPTQDTPLVIDLPDGQKLVVGNLPQGTVIEVATWRGTGRPDSRTNRLMLGVSSGESQKENASSSGAATGEPEPSTKNSLLVKLKKVLSSFLVKVPKTQEIESKNDFKDELESYLEKKSPVVEKKSLEDEIHFEDDLKTQTEDIKSWLDQLMNESGKEFAIATENLEVPSPGESRVAVRRVSVRKPSKTQTRVKQGVKRNSRAKKSSSRGSSNPRKARRK